MTDEEAIGRNEWEEIARLCQGALHTVGISSTILEEGLIDQIEFPAWDLFREYAGVAPVYSIALTDSPGAQLAICTVKMPPQRFRAYEPAAFQDSDSILFDPDDSRLFAIAKLRDDPGYLFIQPKDLETEMSELFHHPKLKIDGFQSFRETHSVYVREPAAAEEVLTSDFFQLVDRLGEAYLEVSNGLMIAGYKQPIDAGQAVALATFIANFATTDQGT